MRTPGFLLPMVLSALLSAQGEPQPRSEDGLLWYDARELLFEGEAWSDELAAPYDRLPARAEALVREPVWKLSQDSAGIRVLFASDAPRIHVEWTLREEQLAMPHMSATGVSGVDLYARSEGRWRWRGNGRPTRYPTNRARFGNELPALEGGRDFALYLPLYNGVRSVRIGVPEGSRVWSTPPSKRRARPIVFYGTSITQGACASRPGMAHAAILGRRLEASIVNLGFSGNGRMEVELAELLAEIDAALYVIDCLPNMTGETVSERTVPFVEHLRAKRPHTPIVLVEDRSYANAGLVPSLARRNAESRAALRMRYEELVAAGVQDLHYLEGSGLLGDDGEATVDGSHPSDLGFVRQADAMEPLLGRLFDESLAPVRVESLSVQRIWDRAPHNAFTDLAYLEGRFYCAFREGRGHASTDGRIRILHSPDGVSWEPQGLVSMEGYDLRDADLSITPAGELMLLGGAAPRPRDGVVAPTGTFASFLRAGAWTTPEIVLPPGRWLWRVTWQGDTAYGFSYPAPEGQGIDLLSSTDGMSWSVLARSIVTEGSPSEAQMQFDAHGGAHALLRRAGVEPCLLQSSPPFESWEVSTLGAPRDAPPRFPSFGGPGLVETFPGVWLAGGRMHEGGAHTALTWVDLEEASMHRLLRLPSGGDTSYPGFVWHEETLFMSYYSSHEGKAGIYLAVIRLAPREGRR